MLFCGYTTGMDALPELLSETVGDATVVDTVDIGGGDAVAVTHRATHVYRSDGLLSDESVETFEHDVERLSVRSKRRKSEIQLATIDSETGFTVPSKVADPIVEAMLEGILRTTGVIEADEAVVAQFRFSELTFVVTEGHLLEHVGSAVWDGDFEAIEHAQLTGLAFEKGSVATQVVIETEQRRRRIKVPNEHAGRVRRAIQKAVFESYDVASLEGLRAELSEEEETEPSPDEAAGSPPADQSSIDVQGASNGPESGAGAERFVSADWTPPADQEVSGTATRNTDAPTRDATAPESDTVGSTGDASAERTTDPDVEALTERVETLSEQVERQTELIESQGELIEQLVDELRRGR
jgi:phosphopantetheine adenylyltransferase